MSKIVRRPTTVYLDRGLRLWILKTARKHFWRIASWYDLADLVQDGHMCYAVCLRKYGDKVDGPAHFCALVKTTFLNHITDMANRRSNTMDAGCGEVTMADISRRGDVPQDVCLEALSGENASVVGDADLVAALSRASEEIRTLMQVIATGKPVGRVVGNSNRHTTNEWLNTLVGTVGHNYEAQLRQLLSLPSGTVCPSSGYTYNSDLEEVRRVAGVHEVARLSRRDRRRVFNIQNFQFRYLPTVV